MKKIDKYLLEHIDVNRRIVFGESSLNEKHGYDEDTVSFVLNNIKPAIEASQEFRDFAKGKTKAAMITLSTDEIGKTPWISSMVIHINWVFDKIQDIGGGYRPRHTKMEEDGLSFSLDIKVSGYNAYAMLNQVIATLSHELLHAYEDYQRRSHGKANLCDVFFQSPYPVFSKMMVDASVPQGQKALFTILYFLNPTERNANLATLYAELKTNCLFLSRDNILSAIKNTTYYKEYNIYKSAIEFLYQVRHNKMGGESFLAAYNSAITMMETYGISLPKMKSFNQLIKFIWVQWRKYDRKWKQNVNKVVYDILDDFCVIR